MVKFFIAAAAAVMIIANPAGGQCAESTPAAPSVQAANPVVVVKSEGVESADISVDKDAVIQLRLPENPSTGYSWNFQVIDVDYLEVIGDEFFYPQGDQQMIGRSGLRVFTLRAVEGGSTMLKLAHWRPWEGLSSRVDKFVINIDIKAKEE